MEPRPGSEMIIGGNDILAQIESEHPKLGIFLRRYVVPAIETTARHAGVSPVAVVAPPAAPQSLSVSVTGEHVQVVVNHSAPIQKGIQYITHIATNPQFSNAIIVDHGSSRAPQHIFLPAKDAGGTPHTYYAATVAQMPGSLPSVTYYGGATPAPFTMIGTTQMDIQPGTGSGTAMNGGDALVGIGRAQVRPAQAAKRTVSGQ